MNYFRLLSMKTFHKIYKLSLKANIILLPYHFGASTPNINELIATKHIWAKKSEMPGLNTNMQTQISNLTRICLPYQKEYDGNKIYLEGVKNKSGPGFGYIEAQALHAMMRYLKPQRVIEVGSGISTHCIIEAIKLNESKSSITCIEPYPYEWLESSTEINLISKPVQMVPLQVFNELDENDFLFIDSSHAVKSGGDVNYLVLEVLPRLKKGVVIHFHDIFFPYDYQRDLLDTLVFSSEASLLQAFLINNTKAEIIFCLSQLHYDYKEVLLGIFPDYNPQNDIYGLVHGIYKPYEPIQQHFPSSIYIKITG